MPAQLHRILILFLGLNENGQDYSIELKSINSTLMKTAQFSRPAITCPACGSPAFSHPPSRQTRHRLLSLAGHLNRATTCQLINLCQVSKAMHQEIKRPAGHLLGKCNSHARRKAQAMPG